MNNIYCIMCGNSSLDITKYNILRTQKASLFILNVPFSDPIAQSQTLQKANTIALQSGTTMPKIFDMLNNIKEQNTVDIVLRVYANIIYSYGIENFMAQCQYVKVKGVIIIDVPYEECNEFKTYCDQYDVHYIPVITKTTEDRIIKILKNTSYLTYINETSKKEIDAILEIVKKYSSFPYITEKQIKNISFHIF